MADALVTIFFAEGTLVFLVARRLFRGFFHGCDFLTFGGHAFIAAFFGAGFSGTSVAAVATGASPISMSKMAPRSSVAIVGRRSWL